ncbi:MAG TPA: M20 family metallopeptidase [Accumulibacter sp.]|nr:M20 family metallopeptidase [Accumulibacter sp.]MDS4054828.1 M20 family metallopeptidase [Accumulibacter sp.]HMV05512.1 M20 family metallopeptidase [Accumulibacter sp.]HMW64198.1 M20 family metallopeptidase [Accumulibacter sp.]HMW81064.1 M20 family metallopeptidase [Accumulibacter sp.]HMX69467.1 M20 family metallopeptidase [Accumulibacter sp.]
MLAAQGIRKHLLRWRRALHQCPETAFAERKTARFVLRELQRLAIPCEYGGVGGGIIARLRGSQSSTPAVALRAELDALPITEQTGLAFASRHPGRMHACAHDGHMAMVLGAAMLLQQNPPAGDVVLIFQPAEEGGCGARVMIEAGALDGVAMIFGGHLTCHYATGQVMAACGPVCAQADGFHIRVSGRGGHGARPHEASDALVASAALVGGLQTLVSRETNPLDPSVVTVGTLHAGSAANAIAHDAQLSGTIRSTRPETRQRLIAGLERMCRAFGEAYQTQIELTFSPTYPPVVNTPRETVLARQAAMSVVGSAGVLTQELPSMGAEDFSFYLERVPGCFVRFGGRGPNTPNLPLHNPQFDFDEEALVVGASYFDAVARLALREAGA